MSEDKIRKAKGFLFDFDGVLADTMQDNFLAWERAFRDFRAEIKKEDYFVLEGLKLIGIAKTLGRKYNVPEEYFMEIVKLKNKYYLENHCFSFYPKIKELIDFLKEKKKSLAIVSASPKERLEKTVSEDFLRKFDIVLSENDYEKGKPEPEPYLTAIKRLNLKPEECVVIENAPLGIESAKSAGAYCIALTTTLSREYLSKADVILNNHQELFHYIRHEFF